jgi:20S proteasome subunit beta 4
MSESSIFAMKGGVDPNDPESGFVILAADANSVISGMIVALNDSDKLMQLDDHKIMGSVGTPGDMVQFGEYVHKNMTLARHRNGVPHTTHAVANYTRSELATALRKGPYQVNIMMGGHDKGKGPDLFFIDYMANMQNVPFAGHGYGAMFCMSTMDRYHSLDMDEQAAQDCMAKCIEQVRNRLVLQTTEYIVKVVDKNGVRNVSKEVMGMVQKR